MLEKPQSNSMPKDIIIFTIKKELFPLLRKCVYNSMTDNRATIAQDSWECVYEVLKYVPIYQLKFMLATQPNSDIHIIEINDQIRYGIWKPPEQDIQLLKESLWLESMGPVQNQRDHDTCWAFSGADIVGAVRWIMKRDTQRIRYSSQDLVDFTDPQLRSVRKTKANNPDHFCYTCHVSQALNFVKENGIAKEEDRPFQFLCQEDVRSRDVSDLAYIGEVVSLMTVKEVIEVLKDHPVSATLPVFEADYWEIGHETYRGPTYPGSEYASMHALNLFGGGVDDMGVRFLTGRSSHGTDFGKDGNLRISIDHMMICLTRGKSGMYLEHPFSLVGEFVYPRLLSPEEEETKRKN